MMDARGILASRRWLSATITLGPGLLATAALVLLYSPWLIEPHIRYDDFHFLTKSRTWAETRANLWAPMNDHVMPLSRLAAGALMEVVDRQSRIPRAAEIQGVAAVALGMWLLYGFVRREFGHSFYGLVAMTLWGVTTTYYENVTWYSASFFTLALDTFLLALLCAQGYRMTQRRQFLAACAVLCALAPAFHSSAILGGLWCALYLIAGSRASRREWSAGAIPLLGTALFVVTSLAIADGSVVYAEHYRGKSVFGAFDLVEGLKNTLRTLADNQIPGAFGWWDRHSTFSMPAVVGICSAFAILAAMWWRGTRDRRLLALGLAILVGSNVLVYSARADWSYEKTVHNWTRYHLFPHLGLVLFAIGGLPRLEGRWFHLSPGGLSWRQSAAVAALVAALTACHWPRSSGSHFPAADQAAVLKRIERIDAACRATGIDAATARQALGFQQFPFGLPGDNAWEFLRGSPSPAPISVEQARAVLRRVP